MQIEKIIAAIESYVNASSETENATLFKSYLSEKREIQEALLYNIPCPVYDLAETVVQLREEFKESEIKKNRGTSELNRRKKALSILSKNERDDCQKPFTTTINEEEYQTIMLQTAAAVFLNKSARFDDLPENLPNTHNLAAVVPQNWQEFKSYQINDDIIGDVKSSYKLYKAENKSNKNKNDRRIKIHDTSFSIELLIDTISVLGGSDVRLYLNNNISSPNIITSSNGMAIIMPVRPADDSAYIYKIA